MRAVFAVLLLLCFIAACALMRAVSEKRAQERERRRTRERVRP